ncbi:MAG: DUF433 domain-containing protein [Phormidesmis sp. CAN_BIN44]|nr:DUF433 domain-containing protein [Phormidesmis sp. CAN_BIN44]
MSVSPTPTKQYIEQRDEGYWVEETRISLDSIVYSFLAGDSPESIAQNFPLLSLEQIYGSIAFYLANRELIDAYLKEGENEFEALRRSLRQKNPALYQNLAEAQAQKQPSRSDRSH